MREGGSCGDGEEWIPGAMDLYEQGPYFGDGGRQKRAHRRCQREQRWLEQRRGEGKERLRGGIDRGDERQEDGKTDGVMEVLEHSLPTIVRMHLKACRVPPR